MGLCTMSSGCLLLPVPIVMKRSTSSTGHIYMDWLIASLLVLNTVKLPADPSESFAEMQHINMTDRDYFYHRVRGG